MSTRRRAREVSLQVLYQFDLNPSAASIDYKPFLYARLQDSASVIFSKALFSWTETRDVIVLLGMCLTFPSW